MEQNSIKTPLAKSFSFSEIISIVLIISQIALYSAMWFQLLANPTLKTMDFISLYGTGRLIREGNYKLIYDYNAEAAAQREVVKSNEYDPLIFNHPPHVTPLLGLIATKDYVAAYVYWSILRLLILLLCMELTRRHFLSLGWRHRSALLSAIGIITFFPVFISILGGQDTIFTLFGLLIWMFALLGRREVAAGFGLAFATLTPTIAGVLALPLLASRRKAGWWFLVGVVVLAIYSILLVGISGISEFIELLRTSSEGTYYGINWSAMYNLLGLLLRALPSMDLEMAKKIAWLVAILTIISLCIFWWEKKYDLNHFHIGLAVAVSTLTAPHLHLHGMSFLILPMIALLSMIHQSKFKAMSVAIAPVISSIIVVIEFIFPAWRYVASYLLFIFLIAGLVVLRPKSFSAQ